MNSSSNIEPFILKSIEEIEDNASQEETAFISFFEEIEEEKQGELKEKEPQDNEQTIDIEAETRRIFEDAYKEGEKAGFEMGMKKVEPIIRRLNRDLSAIESFKEEMMKKVEKMAVELAVYFTEALILKECIEHKDTLINMVKKALEICDDRSHIKIRMRSDDIKYISEENILTLNIIPDDSMDEPGFIIETNFGEIDGRISSQIDELKRQFLEKEKGE